MAKQEANPVKIRLNDTKLTAISGVKLCRRCNKTKPLGFFSKRTGRSFDQRSPYCIKCTREYKTKWHEEHKEEHNKKLRDIYRERKRMVFEAYGNKCACCGELNPLFLTLDHKFNNGAIERKKLTKFNDGRSGGYQVYKKAIAEKYPDTYQLLCWNCNCGKRVNNGVCPHEQRE